MDNSALNRVITAHPRVFETNRYVYPVISRRARGLSVGVNLNPDKICNFDCIYCQVDRTVAPQYRDVDLNVLQQELRNLLEDTQLGVLFNHPNYRDVPDAFKRINDIAFSGDGEPTTFPEFGAAVHMAAQIKRDLKLDDVKIVAITNATRFHRPNVMAALEEMQQNNGEIWAKLDAGTKDYYHLIDRTRVSFDQVVKNIQAVAQRWPIVIQSLFMRVNKEGPSNAEIAAYSNILADVKKQGGQFKGIQIHTVARPPAETYVTPLSNEEVDAIANAVRQELPDIPVDTYYGVTT